MELAHIMKKSAFIILFVLSAAVWAYFTLTAPARQKLVLTGSSTVAPLAAEIGRLFESQYPGVRIDVQTGGSSRGVKDARMELADIGMASRTLKATESDLLSFTIALDGISIILNRDNPITALNKQQIIDIYTGKIVNWQAVGGSKAPITVVNKAEGHSTLELFLHYLGLKNTQVKPQVVIGDNQQGIKTVAGNINAIGYVSIGAAEYEAMHGTAIKLLPLNGIPASVKNVQNQSFPLSRPLNLITKKQPTGIIKAFIDFARSPEVNPIIEAQYFVPVAN